MIVLNLELTEVEDMVGLMETMHSQSPVHLSQKLILEKLFPVYDLSYELVNVEFIEEDDDYAYARIRA